MILSCNLCNYIDTFYEEYNENQVWEFWLHKYTGKSWGDFKLEVIPQDIDIDAVKETSDIVINSLKKGCEGKHGNI